MKIDLLGKVIITGQISALTGLHIGGAGTALDIGGVDNIVIRNQITNQPYIPGSSLRGKMRSLLEKHFGLDQNKPIIRGNKPVRIHECKTGEDYSQCHVCNIFGMPGESDFAKPTRLIVRDVSLDAEFAEKLFKIQTDMPYTEVKWEVVIDRITSAAMPRSMERVPAGAIFSPFELIYSVYNDNTDLENLRYVFKGMELVEDDYLGGLGSRGSGKIRFEDVDVVFKSRKYYDGKAEISSLGKNLTMDDLRSADYSEQIKAEL